MLKQLQKALLWGFGLTVCSGILMETPVTQALTFNFTGRLSDCIDEFCNDNLVEGTYQVNDQILAEALQETEINAVFPNAIEFLEFAVDGIPIFTGIPSVGWMNGIIANVLGAGPGVGSSFVFQSRGNSDYGSFTSGLGFPKPSQNCFQEGCEGVVYIGGLNSLIPFQSKYPASGSARITSEVTTRVPEPGTAIALCNLNQLHSLPR